MTKTPSDEALAALHAAVRDKDEPMLYHRSFTADEIKTIRESLSLLSAVQGGNNGWKPIKTAPRDGTDILAYHLEENYQTRPVIARWSRSTHKWVGSLTSGALSQPTHWQPLPAAPSAAEVGE